MRFTKALWIPIYEYTDDELALSKVIELSDDAGLSLVLDRPFWSIDNAGKSRMEKDSTYFYSGGESFYTPMDLHEFTTMIDKHIKTM